MELSVLSQCQISNIINDYLLSNCSPGVRALLIIVCENSSSLQSRKERCSHKDSTGSKNKVWKQEEPYLPSPAMTLSLLSPQL